METANVDRTVALAVDDGRLVVEPLRLGVVKLGRGLNVDTVQAVDHHTYMNRQDCFFQGDL